jgi:hypothetical protein
MTTEQKRNLFSAVAEYDRRESRKKGYNPFTAGHLMRALDKMKVDMDEGATVRKALVMNFVGRLLDICLVAVGEPKATPLER